MTSYSASGRNVVWLKTRVLASGQASSPDAAGSKLKLAPTDALLTGRSNLIRTGAFVRTSCAPRPGLISTIWGGLSQAAPRLARTRKARLTARRAATSRADLRGRSAGAVAWPGRAGRA